jgi:hypothetical protein
LFLLNHPLAPVNYASNFRRAYYPIDFPASTRLRTAEHSRGQKIDDSAFRIAADEQGRKPLQIWQVSDQHD